MRSFTSEGLPGRCPECWIRREYCVCADVPQVISRTEVVVIRHLRESFKSTGTVRPAALALRTLRCIDYSEDGQPAIDLQPTYAQPGSYVLFPSDSPSPWPSGAVSRLILIDGTWRQARRMYQRLPSLHSLPQLSLPPKAERVLRLREAPSQVGRSTLEAIADALEILEGESIAAPLHALHRLYVERVFRARGVWNLRSAILGISK